MIKIFDRRLKILQRERAADLLSQSLLFKESEKRLTERFNESSFSFDKALYLGTKLNLNRGKIIQADLSLKLLESKNAVVSDIECLPFKTQSFNVVLSNLLLHWVNDLPGTLIQIRNLLKEGGIFIATILGGNTVIELKQSMLAVEMKMLGGMGARFPPSIDIRDAGMLLERAGFNMPVADIDRITILYDHVVDIMHDLRNMGETNALIERSRKPLTREFIGRVNDYYLKNFGTKNGLPVTYDIITLTGLTV